MKISTIINFCAVLIVVLACNYKPIKRKKSDEETAPILPAQNLPTNIGDETLGPRPAPIPKPSDQHGDDNGGKDAGSNDEDKEKVRRTIVIGVHSFHADDIYTMMDEKNEVFDIFFKKGTFLEVVYPGFPSTSVPNQFTVATGLYPAHHCVVAKKFRDSKLKEFNVDDPDGSLYLGKPIWKTLHDKFGKKSVACMNWPGCKGDFDAKYFVEFDRAKPMDWTERVDQVLEWFSSEQTMKLVMMEHRDFIETSRKHGPKSDQMKQKLNDFIHQIVHLVEKLKSVGQLNLIIVGFGGMVQLKRREPLLPPLHEVPQDDFVVWTMEETMWLVQPNHGKLDETIKYFNDLKSPWMFFADFDIFTKGAHGTRRFPKHWHFDEGCSDRIPEVVIVAKPGYRLSNIRGHENSKACDGYDNYEYDEIPTTPLLGLGPAFKEYWQDVFSKPYKQMQTVDIHLLLCKILGVDPPPEKDSSYSYFNKFIVKIPFLNKQPHSLVEHRKKRL